MQIAVAFAYVAGGAALSKDGGAPREFGFGPARQTLDALALRWIRGKPLQLPQIVHRPAADLIGGTKCAVRRCDIAARMQRGDRVGQPVDQRSVQRAELRHLVELRTAREPAHAHGIVDHRTVAADTQSRARA